MIQHRAVILTFLAAALVACKSGATAPGPVATGPVTVGAVETSQYVAPESDSAAPAPAGPASASSTRYTLDGLVGQVNGRPVYARTILAPLHEQLVQIARQHTGRPFQEQAVAALTIRVNEIVQNALILGEAERDLSEQEQQGLAMHMEEHRAELLRRFGRGSVAVAEQRLRDEQGITLAEALEDYRAKLVVQRYLHQKLFPQVNVTRRDIERYYNDRRAEFSPAPKRTLRLISVMNPADAQAISDALASADADFAELATGEFNRFNREEAGLMQWSQDAPLAIPAMNERLLTLGVGEHAGPFTASNGALWFIFVESVEQLPQRSLKDAQLDIEQTLRRQQFDVLRGRFMQRLYQDGSFTPIEDMIARLYAIVEARYKASPGSP